MMTWGGSTSAGDVSSLRRRALLLSSLLALSLVCGFLAVDQGQGSAASFGGGGTESVTTRYEAESYDGTVGSDTTDATCSNGARRGSAMTTGPLVSIPLTIPADVVSMSVVARGRTAAASTPLFELSGGWSGSIAGPNNASGTCDVHGDFGAFSPYPLTGGARTLTITPAGGVALTLDYVEVTIVTPEATTTTASTTTTTEATTTTEPTTTTTTPPGEPEFSPAEWDAVRVVLVLLSLVFGALFGRVLWGGR